MKAIYIVLIVIASVLVAYFLFGLIIILILNKLLFKSRCSDPNYPCILLPEDFPNMEKEDYQVDFNGKKINGFIYKDKNTTEYKGFAILVHGMFGTHLQYIADVALLVNEGYKVLAFDQYGVGISEGENQVSFYNGVKVLDTVIDDVKERNLNNDLNIILYGHSWGAYCAMQSLTTHPYIHKAILRSGPYKPSYASFQLIKYQVKPLYYSLVPLFPILSFLLSIFGENYKADRNLKDNKNTKILLIYALDDQIVNKENAQAIKLENKYENVECYVTEDGLHNSIITEKSYHKFLVLWSKYKTIQNIQDKNEKAIKEKKFMSSLNRASLLVYQPEVKKKILSFLEL